MSEKAELVAALLAARGVAARDVAGLRFDIGVWRPEPRPRG